MNTKTKIKTMRNINEIFRRGNPYCIGYVEGVLSAMASENAEKELATTKEDGTAAEEKGESDMPCTELPKG